ncbi:MAG TPA: DUF3313 family protein [Steroidobacteraceae bacterium]|nr:DUF3313 family protein [Steroidobacteraceae bacterium]
MDRQANSKRGWAAAAAVLTLFAAGLATAREPTPPTWDGMKRVDRPGLDAVYLREGASLAKYKKVMLDPVEVSFDKNWDSNRTATGTNIGSRVDTQKIRTNVAKLAHDVTKRELERKSGYPLVDTAGEDVLRVRAQIVDLYINAPDTMTPGTRTYVVNAGEMTLIADLYDSQTNALIGHVIDRQRGLEQGPYDLQIANIVTNTAEADRILSIWARRLRAALDKAR